MLVFNKNSARIKDLPTSPVRGGKVAPEVSDHLIPAMTWTDWELLQELHKARNGEGTVTVQFAPPAALSADTELFPSYDKQYESLALPAGVMPAEGQPAMNWQAVAADLQDQIKDWETKCQQLEAKCENKDQYIKELADEVGRLNGALSSLKLTEHTLKYEIKKLSESLQHYRNAYFADQGDKDAK